MQSCKQNHIDDSSLKKKYIDPQTAKIIIDEIAALKVKTAIAEEQLEQLILKNYSCTLYSSSLDKT